MLRLPHRDVFGTRKRARPPLRRLAAACFVAALAACSSDDGGPSVTTGWLGELKGFTQIAGSGNEGVFVRPGRGSVAELRAIYLDRVEITVAPGSDLASVSPEDIAQLRARLADSLQAALSDVVDIRSRRDPDAYLLRVALTNVIVRHGAEPNRPARRETTRFGLDGAALEGVLRDGATNRRRAVIVAPISPEGTAGVATETWAGLLERFPALGSMFRSRFAEAKAAIDDLARQRDEPARR